MLDCGLVNKTGKNGINTMPVNIPPEYESVWNYFCSRKTPVTIKQARKALRISETHARRALEYFVFRELANRYIQSRVYFYRMKE